MERIEHAIDINASVETVYAQCARFSDYPRFMEGVEAVRVADERHLHWRAVTEDGVQEWSSVITERDPARCIAWHDVDGPRRSVTLGFSSLDNDKTRISLSVVATADADSRDGTGDDQAAIRERLSQSLADDLGRLKRLLENEGHDWDDWPSTHDAHAESGQSIPVAANAVPVTSAASAMEAPAGDTSPPVAPVHNRRHTDRPGAGTVKNASDTGRNMVQGLLNGWDQPLSMVRKMSGEMDQLFERLTGRPLSGKGGEGVSGRWAPIVDVAQRGDELVVSADLPGVSRQDVHLEIHDDKLIIEGDRREPGEQKELPGYQRSERRYGRFYRQVLLPARIPSEQIRAMLINGVLEIRMPLPPGMGHRGRRVDIEDRS